MEVMLRGVMIQEHTRSGDVVGATLLRGLATAGTLEALPCFLNHAPRGEGQAGRKLIGHWSGIRFDEEQFGITGWLHSKCWDEWYHKAGYGFSVHAFVRAAEHGGVVYWKDVFQVYSVDLVRDPASPRCRILDLHILSN